VDDEEPKIPNTVRFWRLNTIAGIRMTDWDYPPADPEQKDRQDAAAALLRALETREAEVKARYERITSRGPKGPTP